MSSTQFYAWLLVIDDNILAPCLSTLYLNLSTLYLDLSTLSIDLSTLDITKQKLKKQSSFKLQHFRVLYCLLFARWQYICSLELSTLYLELSTLFLKLSTLFLDPSRVNIYYHIKGKKQNLYIQTATFQCPLLVLDDNILDTWLCLHSF